MSHFIPTTLVVTALLFCSQGARAEASAQTGSTEGGETACETLKSEVARVCRDRLTRGFTKVNCRSVVKAYLEIAQKRAQGAGGQEASCQGWVEQIRRGYARGDALHPESEAPQACKALATKLDEKCIQTMDSGRLSLACDMALTTVSGGPRSGTVERGLEQRCVTAARFLK